MHEVLMNHTAFQVHAKQRLSEAQQLWRTANQCAPQPEVARSEAVVRVLPCGKQVAGTPARLVAQR